MSEQETILESTEAEVFVRLMGHNLTNMPNGKRLIVASAAFRNEPVPW